MYVYQFASYYTGLELSVKVDVTIERGLEFLRSNARVLLLTLGKAGLYCWEQSVISVYATLGPDARELRKVALSPSMCTESTVTL